MVNKKWLALVGKVLTIFLFGVILLNGIKVLGKNNDNDYTKKMSKLTLEEKIEQMLIVDIPYIYEENKNVEFTKVTDGVKEFLKDRKPGGVILFKSNMKSVEQTKTLTNDIQNCKKDFPFFIAVDEEGGRISHIPSKPNMKTAREIGSTNNIKRASEAGLKTGKDLEKLGFNVNLAPVLDVNTNPKNTVIGDRSFGSDTNKVSKFGIEYINSLRKSKVLATAKHFPGHGDTEKDSHLGVSEVTKDIKTIEDIHLPPFKEAIKNEVDFIMVGNITVPSLDDTKVPASLSKKIVTDLLKNEMGFKGIVITDALDMGAITQNYNNYEAVKLAINAGCDMVLMPDIKLIIDKDVSQYDELIKYIKDEVLSGNIKEERINESVAKILEYKSKI